jgi:hypothetical protein
MTILRPRISIAGFALLGLFSALASAQPPKIRVIQDTSKAIVHEPYAVSYEVTWGGDAAERAVLPPAPLTLDWADVTIGSTVAQVRDGANVIQHNVVLYPREAGTFEFPPMTLAYVDPAKIPSSEDGEESDPPIFPTISTEGFQLDVSNPPDPLRYVVGGALLLGVLAGGITLLRRRQVAAAGAAGSIPMPTVSDAINAARQHRLDRRHYEFYQALIRGATLMGGATEPTRLKTVFETKAREVGYQGYNPTEDELDGALRDLERAYNQEKGSKA